MWETLVLLLTSFVDVASGDTRAPVVRFYKQILLYTFLASVASGGHSRSCNALQNYLFLNKYANNCSF